jgi:membrane-associated phospholipid phosphatase
MFRQNGLKMAKTEEIKTFNNFNPGIQLKKNLDFQEKVHLINPDPSKRLLPTSTFPSMHAAWGVITAYSAMTISPWLGIVFVPWAILNGIGSVYILEHFAVDIFFGTFIALLSIIITEILLRFENKYFEDKFGLFLGFDYVRIMFKNISAAIQGLIK